MTLSSAVTFPDIEETPTTSNARDLFWGVKTTLNRDAVKFELSWHGLSDFDSINRIADENGSMARRIARRENGVDNDE
jgi:hypothetical protein